MARPAKHDWQEIRRNYEAGMSQPDIVRKFKCDKGSLSKKIKSEIWEINQLANSVVCGKVEVIQQINQLVDIDPELARVSEEIADDRAKHLTFFKNSALRNQNIANKAIDAVESMIKDAGTKEKKQELAMAALTTMRDHSTITKTNKEIVLGKDIETQVNIQNNTGSEPKVLTIDDIYQDN